MEEKNNPTTPKEGVDAVNKRDEQSTEDNPLSNLDVIAKTDSEAPQAKISKRESCKNESILTSARGKTCPKRPETRRKLILLHQKSAMRSRDDKQPREDVFDRRDDGSKMASRGEPATVAPPGGEAANQPEKFPNAATDPLAKQQPATIMLRQRGCKEDSDYVRDSAETSSGSSSSVTSGYRAQKVKRIQRAVRNKNRSNTEVRRNPMRVSKRDVEKDFSHSRQRLLSAKRKETLAQLEAAKRAKTGTTMPYMNTRSVTRKMYTVGATYQPPSKRDETEWKEWPVHGMHERPVYHPQVGLAVEYLGKYFVSLDGLSYREIVDQPEIEIVSVDPRCGTPNYTDEKKRYKGPKYRGSSTFKREDSKSSRKRGESFATCMHGSLHCVLAYCSQVMSPSYRRDVDEKSKTLKGSKIVTQTEMPCKKDFSKTESNAMKVEVKENRIEENCTVTSNSNVKNIHQPLKQKILPKSFVDQRKPSFNTIQLKNIQCNQLKLKEILRHPTKNLILLKATDAKPILPQRAQPIYKAVPGELNLYKLEESAISDETLMEISSIYKNLVPDDNSLSKETLAKGASKFRGAKQINRSLDFVPVKRIEQRTRERKENAEVGESMAKATSSSTIGRCGKIPGNVATWYTSDTSEIARILAEYNKGASRNPVASSQSCPSRTCRPEVAGNQMNLDLKLQQDKWRRCRFAVDNARNTTILENTLNALSVRNWPTLARSQQVGNSTVTSQFVVQRQSSNQSRVPGVLQESKVEKESDAIEAGFDTNETSTKDDQSPAFKSQSLSELLEDTAVLYCAATGVHQDDLKNYIDALDAKQSVQWLSTYGSQLT